MILGVEEEEQNGHTMPTKITWGKANLSKEKLESILTSNIHPSIDDLKIYPIRNQNGEIIFLIEIPQSGGRPHMASDHRYYLRHNFQKLPMEHYEVVQQIRRNETIRREHASFLTGAPLDKLRESIRRTDSGEILWVWALQQDKFTVFSMHLNQADSIEEGLLMSHIRSGYPDLYNSLMQYENLFNEVAKEVFEIYSSIFFDAQGVSSSFTKGI